MTQRTTDDKPKLRVKGPKRRRAFPKPGDAAPASLQPRQELFAHEYVVDLNGTKAALRAGYSPKAAGQQACHLLKNPRVSALIGQLLDERKAKAIANADEIRAEATRLVRSRVPRAFNDGGGLKHPHEWDDDFAAAVSSIEVRTEMEGHGEDAVPVTVTKIKLWDKNAAIRTMAQIEGLVGADVQVNIGDEVAEKLAAARARAKARKEAK